MVRPNFRGLRLTGSRTSMRFEGRSLLRDDGIDSVRQFEDDEPWFGVRTFVHGRPCSAHQNALEKLC